MAHRKRRGVAVVSANVTSVTLVRPAAFLSGRQRPSGIPGTTPFFVPGIFLVFPRTPVSTNPLIHKYYFHMLSLAHARIIYYLLELACVNRSLNPTSAPARPLRKPNETRFL